MPSYYSSSSSSQTFSSSTRHGQTETRSYSEQTQTNPDGTTIRTAYQHNDQPVRRTEEHYPSNRHLGSSSGHNVSRRIEDVSDPKADRRYKEAIEDEYAKREGGA